MRRFVVAALSTAVLALSFAATAFAQGYPGASAAASDTTPAPGEPVTVVAEGFAPASTVTVALRGEAVGRCVANQEGECAVTFTIPAGAACGPATIAVQGTGADGAPRSVGIPINILCAQAVAITGPNVSLAVVLLTILAVVGLAAFAGSRRRRVAARM